MSFIKNFNQKILISINSANEKSLFLFIARILNPGFVFDIGSRDANDAIMFRKVIPQKSRIFAIEASPSLFKKMKKNPILKKKKIEIFNYAIERKEGIKNFYTFSKKKGTGSLIKRNNKTNLKKTKVKTISLDRLINILKIRYLKKAFLWIDVEGSSYDVIKGARSTLSNVDAIIIELETKELFYKQRLANIVIKEIKKFDFDIIEIAQNHDRTSGNYIFLKKKYLNSIKITFLILLYKFYTYFIKFKLLLLR
jgi:FkbM family methyltransferase